MTFVPSKIVILALCKLPCTVEISCPAVGGKGRAVALFEAGAAPVEGLGAVGFADAAAAESGACDRLLILT